MHLLRVSVVRVQKLMLQVQRQLLLLTSRGWGGILSSRPYVHKINNCNVCTYNVILITRLIVRPTAKTHTHPRGANRPTQFVIPFSANPTSLSDKPDSFSA